MTKVSIQVLQDGRPIPGFPWLRREDFRYFSALHNLITSTASYNSVIPALDVALTYHVGFVLLLADKIVLLATEDPVPTKPVTLPANRLFIVGGSQMVHTNALNAVRVKATVINTNLFAVVGVR